MHRAASAGSVARNINSSPSFPMHRRNINSSNSTHTHNRNSRNNWDSSNSSNSRGSDQYNQYEEKPTPYNKPLPVSVYPVYPVYAVVTKDMDESACCAVTVIANIREKSATAGDLKKQLTKLETQLLTSPFAKRLI